VFKGKEKARIMFDFLHRPGVRSPSAAICFALEADGIPPADIAALSVAESPGVYAGRKVTYFRVFDPQRAADANVDISTKDAYQDLGAHLDLVPREGFIEHDGTVVISAQPPANGAVPYRRLAVRAAHADDERYVFAGSR
jgi:hypothetical protein